MPDTDLQPEELDQANAERLARRKAALAILSDWTSLFLCIALVAALVAGMPRMQAEAAQLNATTPAVKFAWPPLAGFISSEPPTPTSEPMTWVNAEMRMELEQMVLSRLGPDPFDRSGLAAARDALARTGWFRDDLRLARDPSGLVRVTGSWRIPAAAVRYANQDMLVSAAGELLPVKYRPDASGYKVIVGVAQPPPEPGKLWIGGDVQAGLKLLEFLGKLPCQEQVAAVDVSQYTPGRTLAIVTDLGNRILWGGPIDEFNPGQAAPGVKLQRLAQVCREQGRIDAGRQLIDVRLLDGVYVHDTAGVMERAMAAPPDAKKGDKLDKSKARKTVSR
jgi:hypothetical protein